MSNEGLKIIGIISCGKRKIWDTGKVSKNEKVEAEEAYTGSYFKTQQK